MLESPSRIQVPLQSFYCNVVTSAIPPFSAAGGINVRFQGYRARGALRALSKNFIPSSMKLKSPYMFFTLIVPAKARCKALSTTAKLKL